LARPVRRLERICELLQDGYTVVLYLAPANVVI
jgi:hypothetical protein